MNPVPEAAAAVSALQRAGATVATAESLTGGLLCATLVDVPGASAVVAGAIVAYSPEVKVAALDVPADLIAEKGTVDPATALAMARGALRAITGATIAVSTTGVAGPDPSEGKPVGTVHVAVCSADDETVRSLSLTGSRAQIRERTVHAALSLLVATLGEQD